MKKKQSCKINWLYRCMKMSLKSLTSSGSQMKRPSLTLPCCHLRCDLDDVESQADGWKAQQTVFRRAMGGGVCVGRGFPEQPQHTWKQMGANESEGRQVQTKLARKKFHRMSGGSGAHSPDLMVLSKENTPLVLTAVQARNICQSGHLIAFNKI